MRLAPGAAFPRDTSSMQLTLRSLTVLSPEEVAITLADDAGTEATFRFTVEQVQGIWVASGEPAFDARYRCVPGPALPMWPEQLAIAALQAVRQPLPDAEAAAPLNAQVREELHRRSPNTAQRINDSGH